MGPTPGHGLRALRKQTSNTLWPAPRPTTAASVPPVRVTWSEFAADLLNLTLASPSVNRHQKSDKDVSEWLPDLNQCWYVDRTVQVRREYGLTIDHAEADAIDRVLAGCESTEMVVLSPGGSTTATATPTPIPIVDALALWDDNGTAGSPARRLVPTA